MPPADIDPTSGFRLPLPKRDELDDERRALYDRALTPGAHTVGLQGPAGVQLHTKAGPMLSALNRYLRFESGIPPRVRETAILSTAREMDSQFEWVQHEPDAIKAGVPQETIEAIKFRKPTDGLDATDALVIALNRQIWRDHKVDSETFARAKAAFGAGMLVDLIILMGAYANTAALLAAVDMQLQDGQTPLLPIP